MHIVQDSKPVLLGSLFASVRILSYPRQDLLIRPSLDIPFPNSFRSPWYCLLWHRVDAMLGFLGSSPLPHADPLALISLKTQKKNDLWKVKDIPKEE